MPEYRKPIPKTQVELSQNTKEPYIIQGENKDSVSKNRGEQRSVKSSDVKQFSLGLRDIDEAIVYYFQNVIRPSVIQNNKSLNVPILYGSPERWASVQKDGYYRDKNGKIQAPLIMYKRDNIQKNRNLGNKLDANNPNNFGVFEKKFSRKNIYDRFSILTNREPIKEYYGVIYPDYVNITYSCIIFTDYIEQMNKIVESINFASDSYWGDPQKFTFRAMIDSFTTSTTLNVGEDRKVRTEFDINLLGHIVSDTINAQLNGINKYYSKSSVSFGLEVDGSLESLIARSRTSEREASRRFFDQALTGAQNTGTTIEQATFISLNNSAIADSVTTNTATFNGYSFPTPPIGFTVDQSSFVVFINGVQISQNDRNVAEIGSNIVVTFDTNSIGYTLDNRDVITLTGKFV